MFTLYRILVASSFYTLLPLLLLLVMITGRHRDGLRQRFGCYRLERKRAYRIWVHAASVGEVQAARSIIAELRHQRPEAELVLTTMTQHGRRVAEQQLDPGITCLLAPLDVPGIVERTIAVIDADMYICLETELWPVLIDALRRRNVGVHMANGRITRRSEKKYKRMARLMRHVARCFERMAVISAGDRDRYIALGVNPQRIVVAGNVKYDLALAEPVEAIREKYRRLLAIDGEEVFIAGSTHGDEELRLLPLFDDYERRGNFLFLMAPRHVERVGDICRELHARKITHQLYSALKSGRESRRERLIIIDTMGELASLYAVADFIFCGGSLVEKGGHNLLEAAVWDRAVFYGPHIDDFRDAADLLEQGGAGFRVRDAADLIGKIAYFRMHDALYRQICRRAGDIARAQQGSAARQVEYLLGQEKLKPLSPMK